MKGLVVAANRLPVEIDSNGMLTPSPGGLASALSSVAGEGTHWVGWGGPESGRRRTIEYNDQRLVPVALSAAEVEKYYEGFANSILWPLFHGRLRRVEVRRSWWHSYRVVNERFARMIARVTPVDGTVWIHDYHLLLVPALVRGRRPDVKIGLFVHIPFPNAQLFSILPWRHDVILGMLGADVLGFQVAEDAANFVAAAERLAEMDGLASSLLDGLQHVDIRAFPISVDFAQWDSLGERAEPAASDKRAQLGVEQIFLGIDRLDYTKGITQRLLAFAELLDERRLDAERCAFVQVAVPSRSDVPAYQDERSEVEELIERINSTHPRADGSVPVMHIDSSLDEVDIAAWYRAADVLVVTSLADGMNLVAKEFVAARSDLGGALILSEFAGAAQDLDGALIVNPYDVEAIKEALMSAVEMPAVERAARQSKMRKAVRQYDVHHWARQFLGRLESTVRKVAPPETST
jgi:trehalose 6-phosphate synthase